MQHMLSTQEDYKQEVERMQDSLSFWSKDIKRNRLKLSWRRPIQKLQQVVHNKWNQKDKLHRANLHWQKQLIKWP